MDSLKEAIKNRRKNRSDVYDADEDSDVLGGLQKAYDEIADSKLENLPKKSFGDTYDSKEDIFPNKNKREELNKYSNDIEYIGKNRKNRSERNR